MRTWVIEPRDTLVLRDGAPADGAMRTVGFPWPSSTTGLVRSRAGEDERGEFDVRRREQVRQLAVRGPLLAALDDDGDVAELLPPTPWDCIWHQREGARGLERRRLAPLDPPPGCATDLGVRTLGPVGGLDTLPVTKGAPPPAFWRWAALERWLIDPTAGPDAFDDGLEALPREERTHVSVDNALETARDGALFSTEALRFTTARAAAREGSLSPSRLALAVASDAEMKPGVVRLGGRGRISTLRASASAWPAFPDALASRLAGARALRVILLTPGVFGRGWCPSEERLGARLIAAAVDRPLAHSGWNMETNAPKASRRLAPAGSVYWLEVDDAARWAKERWMTCLSDDEQDARDGFGLCVVGVA